MPERILFSDRPPSHPGELMREIIEGHTYLSMADAARRMGVSQRTLHLWAARRRLGVRLANIRPVTTKRPH